MSTPGFPRLFYSKEPIPTTTILIKNKNESNTKTPKITWSTRVVNFEEQDNFSTNKKILAPYYDNDEGLLDCMDIEDNYDILPTKSGKFKTIFHVPSALLPVVVGPKGSKLRELQEITQTSIKVPRVHEVGVPVKITGHNERSVASARNQITLLVLTKREKFASTHFISIPVDSNDIRANFEKFKKSILKDKITRGVDENIFQNPNKLHMTVEVLSLLDQIEIEHAKQLLSDNVSEIISTHLGKDHYLFRLKGIEIMNDDPSEVDVLYANVKMDNQEDFNDFQEVVDKISNLFYINGYVRKHYEHIKLHVTLMNSLFRRDENKSRKTFDASFIIDKYRDYDFGTAVLKSIDLSIRFTTAATGYYNSEISIPLQA
ncbi:activating signal cointegrator 1 complex subunit 1-like [Coccinella septempunctata]|uniref:activating signal cointegrator 1 complex subunit 1-like n=1 Tax=Coccinella septempunctata TaxID=41139 RepID=UPI001D079BDE|nr:activating signal cointegrator 1 complex subunit 1-like [Coccinella septempunctata]